MVPRSPFLMELMAAQRCGAGVQSVTIHLAGVRPDTCQRLVDYMYTGTCSVRKIRDVMEVIQLRKMLQLDIDIERKIYKKETAVVNNKDVAPESQIPTQTENAPVPSDGNNFSESNREQNDDVFQPKESKEQHVSPIKLSYVRQESKSSSDEVPYENKLRLKAEKISSDGWGSSIFDRVVQSITGNSDEESEEQVDDPQAPIDFESIRKEMYKDVVSEEASPTKEEASSVKEEDAMKAPEEDTKKAPEDDNDSDSDDDSSSSDSSSSDDDSSDSDDDADKDDISRATVKPSSPAKTNIEEEDEDLGFPDLPMTVDGDDGVPTIPTSFLVQQLEDDEKRINESIASFLNGQTPTQDCSECGHSLSSDNYVLHYGIHIEDIKTAKKKLLDSEQAEEEVRLEMEMEQELDTGTASYQEPTPPPTHPLQDVRATSKSSAPVKQSDQEFAKPEDTIEVKINNLQESQKKLSKEIVNFMSKFQRGAKTLECTECQETVIQTTSVHHFKSHINDLSREIEVLMMSKRDNKRKHVQTKDEVSKRKKMSETWPPPKTSAPPQRRPSGGSSKQVDTKPRVGTEEERKKMYKRIYGRKKYQYRIQNRGEEVRVSEDEIDAEIKKEAAKFSGTGMASPNGSGISLTPSEQLRSFVQFGSKEYKHEFKKARDRLYKRKLRVLRTQGIMDNSAALDIPRADIEVEMLGRYTANKTVKAEMEKGAGDPRSDPVSSDPPMHEVRVKTEISALEDDLELSLDNVDMGELIAEAQSMFGDTTMGDIVSAVSGINLPDTSINTTLDEGVGNAINVKGSLKEKPRNYITKGKWTW